MGKYLRPRRGNENEAVDANIKLLNGEIFIEYPEGKGIGKSAGRIVIGNGEDTYAEKVNNSTVAEDFKPFITDPSLYQPIFEDSIPKSDYKYDDEDRGGNIISQMVVGIKLLPELIGYIKKILCEHTDNLRYDNYRINRLEDNGGLFANVLDIQIQVVQVTPPGFPVTSQLNGPYIEGYEFSHWINISADGRTSNNVYIKDSTSQSTFICAFNGTLNPIPYKCYAMYIKRKL